MKCPVCNHENGNASFCERCGSNLTEVASTSSPAGASPDHESAAASGSEYTRWSSKQDSPNHAPQDSSSNTSTPIPIRQPQEQAQTSENQASGDPQNNQWNNMMQNEKVQQAKEVSKQYASYFLSVLVRPYQAMKSVGEQHSFNGWLTMALIAVLYSTYFLIAFSSMEIPGIFVSGFIRPLLLTAIMLIIAVALMYIILKVEKLTFRPKILVAQYGALLVPAVAALVLANVFTIISFSFSLYFVAIAYIIVIVGMNAVVFQYPLNRSKAAIDSIYTVLIANIVLVYVVYRLLLETLLSILSLFYSSFWRM